MLPDHWEMKSVLELGNGRSDTVQTGPFGSQLHAEDYVDDGVPMILIRNIGSNGLVLDDLPRISESDAQRLARYALEPGDIVFSRVGRVGSCFLASEEHAGWIISGQTLRIRVPYTELDPNYFLYALREKDAQDFITGASVGSTRSSINTSILESLRVRIPPFKQQTAIADVLATVDRAIAQTEALIAKQRRIKAGLMHDLLTRGIDEEGNLRHPSTHEFKESAVGLVPVEWEVVRLSDILSFPSGQVDPRHLPYSQWPLIAPDHIESNTGRLLEIRTAAEQGAISGKYRFSSGDVVYSKIRPYLRKAILASFEGLCSADMYPLRPTQDVTPVYLLMIVLGEHFSRFAEAASERSGFPKINRSEMSEYVLALPNLAEQLRCEATYIMLDDLQHKTSRELDKLHRLKTGLMQDLLTGRVSVEPLLRNGGLRESDT